MIGRFVHKTVLTLCSLILAFNVEAQSSVTWTAKAQNEVFEQSSFEINFTLTNTEGRNVRFPSFQGFDVLSGPSVSNSMTIINGAKSSSTSYSFVLMAKKIGTYSIEPASIDINGKSYKTNALKINVVKADIKSKDLDNSDVAALAKLKVSTKKAYVGQQIVGEYYLYYGENIGFSDEPLKPNYDGFFVKDLKVSQTAASAVRIGNRMFESLLIDAVALYPQKPGLAKIKATRYNIQKQIKGRDPFSNPFGSYVQKTLETNDESIDVKALPDGAPSTFSGGVGEYKMDVSIDGNEYTTAQSIHLTMSISGTGDSRQVGPPTQDFGPDFEVFPARLISEKEEIINNVVWHHKSYEYLVTPKKQGQFSIKALFTYFDTNKESYQTLTFDTPQFNVKKVNTIATPFFKNDHVNGQSSNSNLWLYLGILAIAIAIFALWQIVGTKKKTVVHLSQEAIEEQRRKNAALVARNQLTKAAQFMDNQEYSAFYKEIGTAINGYLQNKYNIPTELMEKNYINKRLESLLNGSTLSMDYLDVLQKAELSMYGGFSDKNVKHIYEKATAFIAACEINQD